MCSGMGICNNRSSVFTSSFEVPGVVLLWMNDDSLCCWLDRSGHCISSAPWSLISVMKYQHAGSIVWGNTHKEVVYLCCVMFRFAERGEKQTSVSHINIITVCLVLCFDFIYACMRSQSDDEAGSSTPVCHVVSINRNRTGGGSRSCHSTYDQ